MNLLRLGKNLLLLALLGSSTGLFLQCIYTLQGSEYRCTAQVIFVGDSRIISEVSHNHLAGKNDSDVTQLFIQNQVVGFIPHNVSDFFPILNRFDVNNASITELTRDSLKGLYRLRIFQVNVNQIEGIRGDIFMDNSELQQINLINNPIKHVAHRVFDHLTQLTYLNFQTTTCINSNANTRAATVQLIFQLLLSCPPTFEMIETQIINGEKLEEQFSVIRNETDEQIVEEIGAVRRDTDLQNAELIEEIRVLRQRLDLLEGSLLK